MLANLCWHYFSYSRVEGGEIFIFDQISYGDQEYLLWAMCEQEKKNILQSDFGWTHHKFTNNLVQISYFIKENQPKMVKNWRFCGFGHNFLQDYRINSIPFAYFWTGAILLIYSMFDHIKGHLDIVFLWPLYQIWLLWP
jgi:hypothetical protein